MIPNRKEKAPISYGPCQFPTLGFIVERHLQIKEFESEDFWKIDMRFKTKDEEARFTWARNHLFDKHVSLILFEMAQDAGLAKITSVVKKPKLKYRPNPLNTVEAQKLISRKLRISPEQAMGIMEKLYNKGFLSYPRTETTKFNPTINLRKIVSSLEQSESYGAFAKRIASGELWGGPKNGKLDDKAHPPIHPVKNAR